MSEQLPKAYQLLGVEPGDTEATLNKRFRRALFRCHPDRPDGDPKKAALLNHIHDQFKRNLIDGRIPEPLQMMQLVQGRQPQPQSQVRVIHIQMPFGGWNTGTMSSTTTTTSFGGWRIIL